MEPFNDRRRRNETNEEKAMRPCNKPAIFAILMLAAGTVFAQPYPAKPVRIVVPFAPGGPNDILARVIAQKLTESWGQPVIVENRPGANGNVAAEAVARSDPDGYTLYLMTVSQAIGQSLYKSLTWDIRRDFAPVAHLARVSQILVVNPQTPFKTLGDFVTEAKSRPSTIDYATSGNGSGEHIAGTMLEQMAGVKLSHVPFKTGADAMAAVVGGHVKTSITTLVAARNFVKNGQLRPLAVTSSTRTALYPDVPTVNEAIGLRDYEMYTWYGILTRAGTSAAVVARLNSEVNKALRHPDTLAVLEKSAVEPTGGTAEAFAELLSLEVSKYDRVVRSANVKID